LSSGKRNKEGGSFYRGGEKKKDANKIVFQKPFMGRGGRVFTNIFE